VASTKRPPTLPSGKGNPVSRSTSRAPPRLPYPSSVLTIKPNRLTPWFDEIAATTETLGSSQMTNSGSSSARVSLTSLDSCLIYIHDVSRRFGSNEGPNIAARIRLIARSDFINTFKHHESIDDANRPDQPNLASPSL